jgi:N-acetylglutamate synthase-like GNAT family acetyltransferase
MDRIVAPDPAPGLRRARDNDAEGIGRLVAAAYGHYAPLIGRTPIPMMTDYAVAIREHEVWVLDLDGEIVGVIELALRDDHLWIENVAIAPARQGVGLGRRPLAHAETQARRYERPEVRLLTNERYVRNLAMYARSRYRETRREPYQGTDLVYFAKPVDAPGGS